MVDNFLTIDLGGGFHWSGNWIVQMWWSKNLSNGLRHLVPCARMTLLETYFYDKCKTSRPYRPAIANDLI